MKNVTSIYYIRCKVTRFCAPFPNYKKITRNDQIVMSGKCTMACYNKHLTKYIFTVYFNQLEYNYNFDEIVWSKFNMTDQYITGKLNKFLFF